jgi:hypothetical protein
MFTDCISGLLFNDTVTFSGIVNESIHILASRNWVQTRQQTRLPLMPGTSKIFKWNNHTSHTAMVKRWIGFTQPNSKQSYS